MLVEGCGVEDEEGLGVEALTDVEGLGLGVEALTDVVDFEAAVDLDAFVFGLLRREVLFEAGASSRSSSSSSSSSISSGI